ncbi:MAG: MnhB domain-containing protein, partial [Chitinivibrionales bacterium]|nr:MnhB domain-containing protein [Chitinivibrionales bacterium]
MDITLYLHILLFLMIVGALIAVETSNLLSSIISLGAIGFLLSISFLLLGAPEIAITQIVVEILVLIILIRATINRDLTAISGDREFMGLLVTVAMIFVLSLMVLRVSHHFPLFGHSVLDRIPDAPSHYYIAEGRARTGSDNIIESIILNFRAYDTVGEIAVLFCAIVGALALLRRKGRRHGATPDSGVDSYESPQSPQGMSMLVKTATRWLKGFIMLFGIYLILNGHNSPGGGFTGGVIIACSLVLITLAEGQKRLRVKQMLLATVLASLGALIFLGLAVFDQTRIGFAFKNFIALQTIQHPGVFILST